MAIIQLCGTFAEIKKKIDTLNFSEDKEFTLTLIEESPKIDGYKERAAMMHRYDEEFANVPRVYGILQVPIAEPMTVDRIKELSED